MGDISCRHGTEWTNFISRYFCKFVWIVVLLLCRSSIFYLGFIGRILGEIYFSKWHHIDKKHCYNYSVLITLINWFTETQCKLEVVDRQKSGFWVLWQLCLANLMVIDINCPYFTQPYTDIIPKAATSSFSGSLKSLPNSYGPSSVQLRRFITLQVVTETLSML